MKNSNDTICYSGPHTLKVGNINYFETVSTVEVKRCTAEHAKNKSSVAKRLL